MSLLTMMYARRIIIVMFEVCDKQNVDVKLLVSDTQVCITCIEKPINMLTCCVEEPNGVSFKKHLARILDYAWVVEDGMKLHSFGSQT